LSSVHLLRVCQIRPEPHSLGHPNVTADQMTFIIIINIFLFYNLAMIGPRLLITMITTISNRGLEHRRIWWES
jgi:hypothetical protein